MPTYPVKNLKTGETKELSMTMTEYGQWKEDNPDWDRDWQAGAAASVSGVGDYQDISDGFKDRLRNVKNTTPMPVLRHPAMPVTKKQPSMVGLTKRQMKRKPIGVEHMLNIKALTPAQEKVWDAYDKNQNLFLYGAMVLVRHLWQCISP